jgi:ribonuclease Z
VEDSSAASKNKIRFSKINHVFISHLHGDHFFWMGLVSTFTLLNRATDLYLWSQGLKEIIKLQLRLSNSWTIMVCISTVESNESQLIFEDDKVRVKQFL